MIFKNTFIGNLWSKLIIIENDNNVLSLSKIYKTINGIITRC